jgi:tRNA G18 (ribose-2'-O)-methylase SpoU
VIYDGNKAIVFGSESKGITSFWLENSEERIMIPMSGNQDSLNLSVSVGVILFSTHQHQSR